MGWTPQSPPILPWKWSVPGSAYNYCLNIIPLVLIEIKWVMTFQQEQKKSLFSIQFNGYNSNEKQSIHVPIKL